MTPTPITNAQLNASGYLDAAELVRLITNMMDRGNIAATSKIIEVILTICIEED